MRANELMVGDLFDVHRYECVADGGHFQEWQEYGKIVCITEDYVTVKYIAREEEYGFEDVEHSDLEPIPLTVEILEKNGFMQKQSEFINGDIGIIFTIRGFSFWSKKTIEIACGNGSRINNLPRYVHQLQHALRLCNIEKEIGL